MLEIIKRDGTKLAKVDLVFVPQKGEAIWFGTTVEDSEMFTVDDRVIEIVNGKMNVTVIVK